jgi:hypothetical protein
MGKERAARIGRVVALDMPVDAVLSPIGIE